jgi:hypothetical protein
MHILSVGMKLPTNKAQGQPSTADETEILNKSQLARRLHKCQRTVDEWMRQGRLPYLKVGKAVLFRWSQVLEKLNAFRVN